MSNLITRALLVLLLIPASAQALNLKQLRSRLNKVYLRDNSNLMLAEATKDSILQSSQEEYAGMFPIKVDTAHLTFDSASRIATMPAGYSGIVLSVHKFNRQFTEVIYVPGDSLPEGDNDVITYYTMRERMMVVYPPPVVAESLFVFYASQPTSLIADTADTTECRLQDWLEEPLLMLAASKCWMSADLRLDLADKYYAKYIEEAERLTRTKVERPKP